MKRNLFMPEGDDFSRSEVDAHAEQLKNEAREKLTKLRNNDNSKNQCSCAVPAPYSRKSVSSKSSAPKDFASLLKSMKKK